jgi:hypothetical protein
MAKEKKKIPDHISKFKKLSDKADQMIATTDKHHRNAYDAAVDAILIDKSGYVDQNRLKDKKVREDFADKMADFYITKAKQQFKVGDKAKFDELETELLMNAYAGTTRGKLKIYIRQAGKDFTFDHFNTEMKPKLMKSIEDNLSSATVGHFNDDHIKDIVDYTGANKFLDHGKMTLQDAMGVLGSYETNGAVLEKKFKDKIYYKKPDKK